MSLPSVVRQSFANAAEFCTTIAVAVRVAVKRGPEERAVGLKAGILGAGQTAVHGLTSQEPIVSGYSGGLVQSGRRAGRFPL